MIVPYQKNYQKIVMGLLSFQPDLHDYQRLQEELDWAVKSSDNKILLWKDQNVDQFSAVMILQEGVDYVLVRRMMGTLATQPLITNWQRNNYYEQQAHEEHDE